MQEVSSDEVVHPQPLLIVTFLLLPAHLSDVTYVLRRVAYGSIAHVLNMFFYLLGLLPLTHLIVSLRPTFNITDTGERIITMVPISFTEVS